jgi:hypothetical protein
MGAIWGAGNETMRLAAVRCSWERLSGDCYQGRGVFVCADRSHLLSLIFWVLRIVNNTALEWIVEATYRNHQRSIDRKESIPEPFVSAGGMSERSHKQTSGSWSASVGVLFYETPSAARQLDSASSLKPAKDSPAECGPGSAYAPARQHIRWIVDTQINAANANSNCQQDCEAKKIYFEA